MIRINLANGKAAAAGGGAGGISVEGESYASTADIQKQGALRLGLLLVGPVALWFYQQSAVPQLVSERANIQAQLQEMRDFNTRAEQSVTEIKKFKTDEERIQSRIASLDRISKNRTREIKILELIQQVIPEKAWLNKIETKEGRMILGGMALNDYDVSTFMESLAKSVHFVDVNLVSSTEILFDGLNLRSFEISCTMERPAR